MAKITWKGDESNLEEFNYFGLVCKKGQAVETDDPKILLKASGNPNFKVEGYAEPPQPVGPTAVPAPSTVSAQHPVPKPGEPIGGPEGPPPEPTEPKPKISPVPPAPKAKEGK